MFIVTHRKAFFTLSAVLAVAALISLFTFGLHLGLDFTGGTLVQVSYEDGARPSPTSLSSNLTDAGFEGFSLREAGEQGFILRAQNLTEEQRNNLPAYFAYQGGTGHIDQLTEVGPTIGKELRNKAFIALALVLLCILLFIAFAFRKVSQPVSSWWYGLIALITLIFDTLIPLGFFALLGHYLGAQVDTLFVTAILTILGFSVHDTIVVFDRTRENLRINQEKNRKEGFESVAGRSLSQTFVRSINTSLTVFITLLILYFVGPASTEDFALTLLVGIIAGTYSSIFLATPLLVEIGVRKEGNR